MKAEEIRQRALDSSPEFLKQISSHEHELLFHWIGGWIDETIGLCDEDKWDALITLGCTWEDIQEEHLADLATAQAQVAVMAEALQKLMAWIGPPPKDRHSFDSLREDAWDMARKALSAAPKVVWSGDAVIRHKRSGVAYGTWGGPYTMLRLLHKAGHVGKHGQWNQVIVLDKQGEGECG